MLAPHKNHICCHKYCRKSLSPKWQQKNCMAQDPEMWEPAQAPHCPFCHIINETKGHCRQLATDLTANGNK